MLVPIWAAGSLAALRPWTSAERGFDHVHASLLNSAHLLYYLLSSIKFRVLFPCESGHTRSGSEISFYVVVYGQHLACSMIPFVFQITLFYILNYIIISSQFDSPG